MWTNEADTKIHAAKAIRRWHRCVWFVGCDDVGHLETFHIKATVSKKHLVELATWCSHQACVVTISTGKINFCAAATVCLSSSAVFGQPRLTR